MIKDIRLKNYKSFTDSKFDFTGKNNKPKNFILIYGANGSGKTNFIDAIDFLDSTFQTMNVHFLIMDLLAKDSSPENARKLSGAANFFNISNMIKNNKTIGSTDNMVIELNFLWNDKPGYYCIEFDDEKIVHEKLEYTLKKNKGVYFDISEDNTKLNNLIFTDKVRDEIISLKEKFWGKHSILSMLYYIEKEYSQEYIDSNLDPALKAVLLFFKMFTCRLVDVHDKRDNIGNFKNLLRSFNHGIIQEQDREKLDRTERVVNYYYSLLYHDITGVFYQREKTDNNQIQYTLVFQKMISGKKVDVPYDEESCGTLGLLELLPYFLATSFEGIVAIDEIDNGIHDLLLLHIVERIIPEINGQLIVTTHNTMFLDLYNLRDNIYVIDIDQKGNKSINIINEGDYRIQKSSNVRTQYLHGRFGGIPKIDNKFDFHKICQEVHE